MNTGNISQGKVTDGDRLRYCPECKAVVECEVENNSFSDSFGQVGDYDILEDCPECGTDTLEDKPEKDEEVAV